ncbi:MAG: hypothetical protein C0484_18920 [Rhodospirillum sp.]|nr:hypothetical protein [Rhodospirillum sp.]
MTETRGERSARTYLVRFMNGERKGELVGIIAASSLPELYWVVDEAVDPGACEYAEMPSGGLLWLDRGTALVPYHEHRRTFGVPDEDEKAYAKWRTSLFKGAGISEGWLDPLCTGSQALTWKALVPDATALSKYLRSRSID